MELDLDDTMIMCLCLEFIDSLIWNLNWTECLLNFYSTIKCSNKCLSCSLLTKVFEPFVLAIRSVVVEATFGAICQFKEVATM